MCSFLSTSQDEQLDVAAEAFLVAQDSAPDMRLIGLTSVLDLPGIDGVSPVSWSSIHRHGLALRLGGFIAAERLASQTRIRKCFDLQPGRFFMTSWAGSGLDERSVASCGAE